MFGCRNILSDRSVSQMCFDWTVSTVFSKHSKATKNMSATIDAIAILRDVPNAEDIQSDTGRLGALQASIGGSTRGAAAHSIRCHNGELTVAFNDGRKAVQRINKLIV